MKIIRRGAWPDAMVSRQAVVNCALNSDGVAPGCNGGEPWCVPPPLLSLSLSLALFLSPSLLGISSG